MKTETTQKKSDDCSFFIVGNCTKEFHQTDRWKLIKDLANRLRPLQASDGSITELAYHNDASKIVEQITKELPYLVKRLPFQFEYFEALILDLKTWVDDNFPKPDFSKSLKKFTPERHRQDGVLYFSLFPMATLNGSKMIKFDALVFEILWPEWLDRINTERIGNSKFVSANLLDYTDGYDSECATLFPETVSVNSKIENEFGIILDRKSVV